MYCTCIKTLKSTVYGKDADLFTGEEMYRLVVVVACLVSVTLGAPAADEITNLPGLTHPVPFKHYSGYLSGAEGKHLHYW